MEKVRYFMIPAPANCYSNIIFKRLAILMGCMKISSFLLMILSNPFYAQTKNRLQVVQAVKQISIYAFSSLLGKFHRPHRESAMDCYSRPSSLGCEKNSPLRNHVQEDDRGLREADER